MGIHGYKGIKSFAALFKCAWGRGEVGSWKSASSGIKLGGSSGQPRMSLWLKMLKNEAQIPVLAVSQGSKILLFPFASQSFPLRAPT